MLQLLPLEERIVLDAALMVEAIENDSSDDGTYDESLEAAPDSSAEPLADSDGDGTLAALSLLDGSTNLTESASWLQSLSYREGDGYIPIVAADDLPQLTSGNATWAEITLAGRGHGDVLDLPASTGGFEVTTESGSDYETIRFSASAALLADNSVAEIETLLHNTLAQIRFANISHDPAETMRELVFVVGNGEAVAEIWRALLVESVNDAPTLSDSGANTLQFIEPDDPGARSPVALFEQGSVTVSDVDSAQISKAVVWLSDAPATNGDALGTHDRLYADLPEDGPITSRLEFLPGLDGGLGQLRLTLEGPADAATYARAIESVRYDNLDIDPQRLSRTVFVAVTDLDDDSEREDATSTQPLEKRIEIIPTNTAPVVTVGAGSFDEASDRLKYIPLLPELRLLDPDSDDLLQQVTVTLDNPDAHPADIINTLGSGSGLFEVTRVDQGDKAVLTVRPTAASGTATVEEFRSFLASWTYANISRANTDHVIDVSVSAKDAQDAVAEASAAFVITAAPDAPVSFDLPLDGQAEQLTVLEDGQLPLPPNLFPLSDADGDALAAVSITTVPEHGDLVLDGVVVTAGQRILVEQLDTLIYVPDPDYNGPDGFGFKVWDDSGDGGEPGLSSGEHRAEIAVVPVADAPTSADLPPASAPQVLTVLEDTQLSLPPGLFPFSDVDGDALAAVSITTVPGHGDLVLDGVVVTAGQRIPVEQLDTLIYVPDPDYNGPDGFGFKVWDDSGDGGEPGLSSAEYRSVINVLPVEDPEPIAAVFSTPDSGSGLPEPKVWVTPPLVYESGFQYATIEYEALLEPFTYPEADAGPEDQKVLFALSDSAEICTLHSLLGIGCRFVPAMSPGEYLLATDRGTLAYASAEAPGTLPAELQYKGTFVAEGDALESGFNAELAADLLHKLEESAFDGVAPGEVVLPADGVVVVDEAAPATEPGTDERTQ